MAVASPGTYANHLHLTSVR